MLPLRLSLLVAALYVAAAATSELRPNGGNGGIPGLEGLYNPLGVNSRHAKGLIYATNQEAKAQKGEEKKSDRVDSPPKPMVDSPPEPRVDSPPKMGEAEADKIDPDLRWANVPAGKRAMKLSRGDVHQVREDTKSDEDDEEEATLKYHGWQKKEEEVASRPSGDRSRQLKEGPRVDAGIKLLLEKNSEMKTVLEEQLGDLGRIRHDSLGLEAEVDEMEALLRSESGLKGQRQQQQDSNPAAASILSKVAVDLLKKADDKNDFLSKLDLKMVDERIDRVFEGAPESVRSFVGPTKLAARVLHVMGPSLLSKIIRQVQQTIQRNGLLSATASYLPAYMHSVAGDHRLMAVLLKSVLLNGERYKAAWRAVGADLLVLANSLEEGSEDAARLVAVIRLLVDNALDVGLRECDGMWTRLVDLLETERGRAALVTLVGRVLLTLDTKVIVGWIHGSRGLYEVDEAVFANVMTLLQSFLRPLTDEEIAKAIDVGVYLMEMPLTANQTRKLARLRVRFFRLLEAPTRLRLRNILEPRRECQEEAAMLEDLDAAEKILAGPPAAGGEVALNEGSGGKFKVALPD